jgi:hypothetical protein
MLTRLVLGAAAVLGVGVATSACTAIAGLDAVTFVDDGGDGGGAIGGSGGAAGTGGGTTATGSGGGLGGTGGSMAGGGGIGGAGGDSRTWTVVDTLTLPVDGSDVVSTFVLQDGEGYRLRASGVCIPRDGDEGDAEWYDFSDPKTMDTIGTTDVGIGIDDPIVDGTKTPFWGPYSTSHVYVVDFVGKGAPITAKYHDPVYSNNAGELTVEVLALQ